MVNAWPNLWRPVGYREVVALKKGDEVFVVLRIVDGGTVSVTMEHLLEVFECSFLGMKF
jgi:hypothetical protein